ncbi:DPP IV N-terminal domain-containing protein [Luteolibacter sp. LG18]|uniref:DPP IV N-terminal domain-containing protein n=1 Tax=Luteolibacter sp. LG18 TaxID=2819286 RepID=UPI002B322407|nr:peptidase [Luteolibacter sp. LG18]
MKAPAALFLFSALITGLHAQGTKADYDRARELGGKARSLVNNGTPQVTWTETGTAFARTRDKVLAVDLATGKTREATKQEIDQAKSVSKDAQVIPFGRARSRDGGEPQSLEIRNETQDTIGINWIDSRGDSKPYGTIDPGKSATQSTYAGHVWSITDRDGKPFAMVRTPEYTSVAHITGKPTEAAPSRRPERRSTSGRVSPDGKTETYVQRGTALVIRPLPDGTASTVTELPGGERFDNDPQWSPDSSHFVISSAKEVTVRQVTLVQSSPKDQLQPRVEKVDYVKPGDPIRQPFPRLYDAATKREIRVDHALFPNPWAISDLTWSADSSEFLFVYNQRGHQLMRILGVRASDGQVRVIHEDKTDTFIDYSQKFFIRHLPETKEILWMSERDGWNHLYLIDAATGSIKTQITKGNWNVRDVVDVDVSKRTILFKALGTVPGQDPYYTHFARVNFDGTGLVRLTESNGDHRITFSPDQKYIVDTWSRVDQPAVTELRNAETGKLVCELARADDSALLKTGWSRPEPLVSKGRDGKTEIYGVLIKPSNFDPAKKYPVLENIYSGPHDFFVPKSYYAWTRMNDLAELGFIVVQIDGMGTNWRSKAFHDVAWKNLADAGLPDHIAWIKAAATTRPWMDLSRVGIYGGSAGGQNSLSAMLHHGDFYKACVSDCGCHDNRMDKIWWNEAWMGWPVDESYTRNSNVTDAAKLQGKLMLVVGELDHNVDPSSTLQVANALQKADKDFELLIVTGADHGAAETSYGSRRRADFFVRNLLGVEPRRL